jgi:hypothetical protein
LIMINSWYHHSVRNTCHTIVVWSSRSHGKHHVLYNGTNLSSPVKGLRRFQLMWNLRLLGCVTLKGVMPSGSPTNTLVSWGLRYPLYGATWRLRMVARQTCKHLCWCSGCSRHVLTFSNRRQGRGLYH